MHVNVFFLLGIDTLRRSASPHPTPAAGVPAIPTIPLVQGGTQGRPGGICGGQSSYQRGVT